MFGPRLTRLALVGALSLIATQTVLSTAPAQAQTAGSCSGHVSGRSTLKVDGVVVAETIAYYQPGSGGTNTACMYHRGPAYGVASDTKVQIGRCYGKDCTYAFDGGNFMQDTGNYKSYAGPVRVTGTDHDCVLVEGHFVYRGKFYFFGIPGKVGC